MHLSNFVLCVSALCIIIDLLLIRHGAQKTEIKTVFEYRN